MTSQKITLKQSIAKQRENLIARLKAPLRQVAEECGQVWADREQLNAVLMASFGRLPHCKFHYALDSRAIQVSDNISREGVVVKDFGRDRSQRPYINEVVPSTDFLLSEAYISLRAKRPSLTAIQIVRNADSEVLGFVGADFDLRDLPLTSEHYEEPMYWRQIKGDPAIRSTVFQQQHVDSQLDLHIEDALGIMEELIMDHGVFQMLTHFSSNRATVWTVDDPYRYRLLDIEALTDPDTCLAYPHIDYPAKAVLPVDCIRPILEIISKLRFMDETFYLRSCSLNIFNGMVSLTFSCDGSHYLLYDEFIRKGEDFWLKEAGRS
jgi:hypothetical protein